MKALIADSIVLIIGALLALLCTAMIFGQPPQAPPVIKSAFPRYSQHLLDTTKGPLVIFVGIPGRKVSGAVVCEATSMMRGNKEVLRAIVVSLDRSTAQWYAAEATDAELRAALGVRTSVPFPDADGELERGPWPSTIPFPAEMTRYLPAKYTQEIAVTNNRDRITPVLRSELKTHWQIPGGMEGIEGWRSDLYRYVPSGEPFIANLPVWNGSNYQSNRGWTRTYGDGAVFMDVLSYEGKPFEVRIAEKQDGIWERYIAFKDVTARPPSYQGLKVRCGACHDHFPGTGNYAGPLVSGSDGVFSDPFVALEVAP